MGMLAEREFGRGCTPGSRTYARSIVVLTVAVCILLLANVFILVVMDRVERESARMTIHASRIAEEALAGSMANAAAGLPMEIRVGGERYTRRVDVVGSGENRRVNVSVEWRTLAGERRILVQRPLAAGPEDASPVPAACPGSPGVPGDAANRDQSSSLTLKRERSE
ncbi:MAG: hypothetical protein JW876_03305 [Candidatus Krumholzibacteriota bacterium]|nr:hypothetical protein [Candidatus Krumholzibacteriota bacterium]